MKGKEYIPRYTNTANSKGRPAYKSSLVSPTSDVFSIDENNVEQYNSNLVEIPSANEFVQVQQSSSIKCRIFFIIFGSIILLLAIAAIVVSIILNKNQSSTNSSNSASVTVTTTGITTSTATTALYSCSNFTVTNNWNYPNNDIASVSPMTFSVCCSWCLATSGCTTFVLTVSTSTCWIKTSTGGGGSASANVIAATI